MAVVLCVSECQHAAWQTEHNASPHASIKHPGPCQGVVLALTWQLHRITNEQQSYSNYITSSAPITPVATHAVLTRLPKH